MSEAAVFAGRRVAESLMVDVGAASRPTGTAYDPDVQGEVQTFDAEFGFSSVCKLQARTALGAQVEDVGGRSATTVRLELHLPVDQPALSTGDVWEMTGVSGVSAAVVGDRFVVVAPALKTWMTARRYDVEVVVA